MTTIHTYDHGGNAVIKEVDEFGNVTAEHADPSRPSLAVVQLQNESHGFRDPGEVDNAPSPGGMSVNADNDAAARKEALRKAAVAEVEKAAKEAEREAAVAAAEEKQRESDTAKAKADAKPKADAKK